MAFRQPKKKEAGAKKAEAAEKKAGGASGNLAVMFVMMLAVFLAGSAMVIGYFKFLDPDNKEAQAEENQKNVALSSMEMGGMIVNLVDGDGSHFLKLTITIEYPYDKEVEKHIEKKKHIITETMLLTLRSKKVEEVRPPEAADKLKGELIEAVNKRLGEDLVKKIYFTEYIVH